MSKSRETKHFVAWEDEKGDLLCRIWVCSGGWEWADKPRKVKIDIPSGEMEIDAELEDGRVYVDHEKGWFRLSFWEVSSRKVLLRESHYLGRWCTCCIYDRMEMISMSFVKKALARQASTVRGQEAADPTLKKRCPAIHEFLTLTEVDKKARQTSTLSIFQDGGRWKASLADKDNDCSLYVTAETVEGLWEAMEEALKDDQADWRTWKKGGAAKGKK